MAQARVSRGRVRRGVFSRNGTGGKVVSYGLLVSWRALLVTVSIIYEPLDAGRPLCTVVGPIRAFVLLWGILT